MDSPEQAVNSTVALEGANSMTSTVTMESQPIELVNVNSVEVPAFKMLPL